MHMPFLRHTLKRALWTWTQMPSAPCWKDAEQRKANQRLGSRDPHSISCERREWEKGRWFCAITGKPVLVLYCLCWGFGVLKNHSYLGQEEIPKAGAKTLNIPKCEEAVMWSHKSVWYDFLIISGLHPCLIRLVLNMIFYGIMLYVPGLAGNLYLNLFLMFLTDLPHTPMAWIVFR